MDALDFSPCRYREGAPSTFSTAMSIPQNLNHPNFVKYTSSMDVTVRCIGVFFGLRQCGQENRGINEIGEVLSQGRFARGRSKDGHLVIRSAMVPIFLGSKADRRIYYQSTNMLASGQIVE
ncbi:MAG: hypothetical protein Q9225_003106 [Loekoesia sp. 1 TL-2023]